MESSGDLVPCFSPTSITHQQRPGFELPSDEPAVTLRKTKQWIMRDPSLGPDRLCEPQLWTGFLGAAFSMLADSGHV